MRDLLSAVDELGLMAISQSMSAWDFEVMISSCTVLRIAGISTTDGRIVWVRFCTQTRLLGLSTTSHRHIHKLCGSLRCCPRRLYWQCSPLRIRTSAPSDDGSTFPHSRYRLIRSMVRWYMHRSCYSHVPSMPLPETLRQSGDAMDWLFVEFTEIKVGVRYPCPVLPGVCSVPYCNLPCLSPCSAM
jgi:hypothetical protein